MPILRRENFPRSHFCTYRILLIQSSFFLINERLRVRSLIPSIFQLIVLAFRQSFDNSDTHVDDCEIANLMIFRSRNELRCKKRVIMIRERQRDDWQRVRLRLENSYRTLLSIHVFVVTHFIKGTPLSFVSNDGKDSTL